MADEPSNSGQRLVLPCEDDDEWQFIVHSLSCSPVDTPEEVDAVLTQFARRDREREQHHGRPCTFFADHSSDSSCGDFDFSAFMKHGLPFMIEVALDMPTLFTDPIPISLPRSSWPLEPRSLGCRRFELSRRQCACLLAHSVFGSLRRPAGVQRNDFRFTAFDLFMGTAVSPASAFAVLQYFMVLGRDGIPHGSLAFERLGYQKGPSPWEWEGNETPLCLVDLVDGAIDDCAAADLHAEFANAYVGGGVMTGDAAMEEIQFLVQPELMIVMALENRMVDEEAVRVSGALKYSTMKGFGSGLEFAGECDQDRANPESIATVCAIDAIRGGGPAMTEAALLRDMNKARIAFDGAHQLATGHWGCGAFGNNHDLMFLKQWLAASEAGVTRMYYHDFDRKQSHHIFPLVRKLKHLTVGKLWQFLREITGDLKAYDVATFSKRIADIAVGRIKVPVYI